MSICDNCPINDKVYECCGRHPETGKQVRFAIGLEAPVYACPHLSVAGECSIYENRPLACQVHFCHLHKRLDDIGKGCHELHAFLDMFNEFLDGPG